MECVVVQWIDHILESAWSVDIDEWVIDRIWHRGIDSPVPVRNSKCGSGCLVLGSLSCRIRGSDLLGVVPKDLLV